MDKRFSIRVERLPSGKKASCLIYEGKAPKNQDEAFDIAIAKWEAIIEHPEIGLSGGSTTCGLCMMYLYYDYGLSDRCKGCPIAIETGADGCSKFTEMNNWMRAIHTDAETAQTHACTVVLRLKELKEKYAIRSGK